MGTGYYGWIFKRMNYKASDFSFTILNHYFPIIFPWSFLFLILLQLIIYITGITDNLVPQRDFLTPVIITKSSNFYRAPFNINVFKL